MRLFRTLFVYKLKGAEQLPDIELIYLVKDLIIIITNNSLADLDLQYNLNL